MFLHLLRLVILAMATTLVTGQEPVTNGSGRLDVTGIHGLVKSWCNDPSSHAATIEKHGTIADWDVSMVTDMLGLFSTTQGVDSQCNPDISGWDTSEVTDMSSMVGVIMVL